MVDFVPEERATAIRQPSTANFLIDSLDRTNYQPGLGAGSFLISKQQSLLNGFFTRLAVTELAISWNVNTIFNDSSGAALNPQFIADASNNYVNFDISGATTTKGVLVRMIPGTYSPADALNTLVATYNALPAATRDSTTIAVSSTGGTYTLSMTGGAFRFILGQNSTSWISSFFPRVLPAAARVTSYTAPTSQGTSSSVAPASNATGIWSRWTGLGRANGQRTLPRYLDFTCSQMTYNQALKDASTGTDDRDVLVRYYFGFTNDAIQIDSLGFPQWMGYKPFYIRRQFTPPKQIRWTANQPIGVLKFEVYDDNGQLFNLPGFEWDMTVQVSEV